MTKYYTFAIPDLHGRYDLMKLALDHIESNYEAGTIVFLGDYVDRGPQSRQILETLIEGKPYDSNWLWVCLKGNHEDLMLHALSERRMGSMRDWLINGGNTTLDSYPNEQVPQEHLNWIENLPTYYKDKHRVYVHAFVNVNRPLAQHTELELLWMRHQPFDQDLPCEEGYVVHGHTPISQGPLILENRINLDTGAMWNNKLHVAKFDDDLPGKPIDILTFTNYRNEID